MPIKRLDSRQQLAVVAAGDEHLGVRAHGGLEDGKGSRGEFVLFKLRDLELGEFVARLVEEFGDLCCVRHDVVVVMLDF